MTKDCQVKNVTTFNIYEALLHLFEYDMNTHAPYLYVSTVYHHQICSSVYAVLSAFVPVARLNREEKTGTIEHPPSFRTGTFCDRKQ